MACDITDARALIEYWSRFSGKPSEHMTVNILQAQLQVGVQYKAMASLSIPSMWLAEDVNRLQLGLARAIAEFFSISIASVHVVTTVIESDLVVENGEQIHW